MEAPPLYLLDLGSVIRHVLRESDHASSVDRFIDWADRFLEGRKPERLIASIDSLEDSWRRKLLPDYRTIRLARSPGLRAAYEDIPNLLRSVGVTVVDQEGIEAKDILASIIRLMTNGTILVVTSDRDLYQLASQNIVLTGPIVGMVDPDTLLQAQLSEIQSTLGCAPEGYYGVLALAGDRHLGIPGVPALGWKRAAKLMAHFGSTEEILRRLHEVQQLPGFGKKIVDSLKRSEDLIQQNLQITGLDSHVELKPAELDDSCEYAPLMRWLQARRTTNTPTTGEENAPAPATSGQHPDTNLSTPLAQACDPQEEASETEAGQRNPNTKGRDATGGFTANNSFFSVTTANPASVTDAPLVTLIEPVEVGLTADQREQRKGRITASQVPKILGLSRYGGPFSCWAAITGRDETGGQLSEPAELGLLYEDAALRLLARRHPDWIVWHNRGRTWERDSWAAATPDGGTGTPDNPEQGIEIKHRARVRSNSGWGPSGTSEIPPDVLVQCLFQAWVCGFDSMLVALGAHLTLREYPITPDPEATAALIERLEAWYQKHVVEDEEPVVADALPDTLKALRAIHGESTGEILEPDSGILELARRRHAWSERARQADHYKQICDARLRQRLGAADRIEGVVKRREERGRLDYRRMVRDLELAPDQLEQWRNKPTNKQVFLWRPNT